ncbi:MgtC/SapB transporter [Alkaliphilus metalliredigens QYMF]|uniref:MgtC/SapB transporter n=1 Tax=Alkaliphilus metalliredigens (strain QYMF) TaxID=293826 RepID=A6TSQ3_ALKMQ|nr:MgtC/SapB family protein [Alkaliphilus metalliredigens]ABR49221.1 MgtC/SapB transporter [Alkaliphilus metalliredigens QYMF]
MISTWETILRLVLSAITGGLVGMEREASNRPAGLRTHVLVTLGSTLIMLISMYGFDGLGVGGQGGDPARLAAQVVSGIGFLGAGTILRTGSNIRGLTTAASIWVCGGIGLAIGNGYYVGGITTAVIVLFTLKSLGAIEKKLFKKKYRSLILQCIERPGLIGDIGHVLGRNHIAIRDIKVIAEDEEEDDENEEGYRIEVRFMVKLPSKFTKDSFFNEICQIKGVEQAMWESDMLRKEYHTNLNI